MSSLTLTPTPEGTMADNPQIPIFVVSLADSRDRRETLAGALGALGLGFAFIDAIDGRKGLPAEYSGTADPAGSLKRLGRTLSDAEIAASLSHRLACKRMLDEGHDHALILEDDAMLKPGLQGFLAVEGYRFAPMILLHHLNARVLPGVRATAADGTVLRELAVPCFRAAAYTVDRTAARYLIDANTPVTTPPDWPGDITRFGACVTEPQLVDHPPANTSQSILHASGRTRDRAPASRMLAPSYWRRVWRKLQSERIS